ncbi:MAG: YbjN domain-containing protein [Neomegalonema sp.]|nr:YbjN domain-containing protein [Neomegalonema sp.]
MFRAILAAAFSAALLFSGQFAARAEVITGADKAKIAAMAKKLGEASLKTDAAGQDFISAKIEGVAYVIQFVGCGVKRGCANLRFLTVWDPAADDKRAQDLQRANEWNRQKRIGVAYLDEKGSVVVKMEVSLEAGVERATLEDSFDWWRRAMVEFPKFFFD